MIWSPSEAALLRALKSCAVVLEIICFPHKSYLFRDVYEVPESV